MDRIPSAAAAAVVVVIVLSTVSFMGIHAVFADSYKKSQSASQTNECSNYWFPVNVICSNINSQVQGDENNVVIATTSPAPDKNYGPPFP
jgi:hypothetical protein